MTPQTRTHALTESRPMTSEQFYGRIANNSSVSIVHHTGYIDVFRDGQHVARWLPYPRILHFIPKTDTLERTLEDQGQWPPSCPDCGGPMTIKFGGSPREPFWSCRHWDGPRPRVCEGRMPFTLHPDDLAEYDEYNPVKWRELVMRSLARLNGDGQQLDKCNTIVLGTSVLPTGVREVAR